MEKAGAKPVHLKAALVAMNKEGVFRDRKDELKDELDLAEGKLVAKVKKRKPGEQGLLE